MSTDASERAQIQQLRDRWREEASRSITFGHESVWLERCADELDALLSRLASSPAMRRFTPKVQTSGLNDIRPVMVEDPNGAYVLHHEAASSPGAISQPTFHDIEMFDAGKYELGSENDGILLRQRSNNAERPEQVLMVHRSAIPALMERLAASSPAQPEPAWQALIDGIVQEVAELPDRTSPDDWPEAMLVTSDELRAILLARLAEPAQWAIVPSQSGDEWFAIKGRIELGPFATPRQAQVAAASSEAVAPHVPTGEPT